MKIFWSMNVYSRGDLLKLQQDLIREYFGDQIHIWVYCNSGQDFRHKESEYFVTTENSGHHNGVRDSYNETVKLLDGFDYVVSTHADCLFTDYSIVDIILETVKKQNKKFACLAADKGVNPHKPDLGMLPRAHADFFVCETELFKKMFPTDYNMDEWEGIECFLGRTVQGLTNEDERWVIPAVENFEDRPHRFENILGTGTHILRDNTLLPNRGNYEFIKQRLK